ncbi:MAG: hypothetical protein ACW97Z_07295 [Candidatus Hodarchaeales archaeon]|jgi:hypothetical protein
MLRRKKTKWFEAVSTAQSPIRIEEFSSKTDKMNVIAFIYEKIQHQELKGVLDYNHNYFIPNSHVYRKIQQFLDTQGVVDICDLIDLLNIPGKLLESIIHEYVQKIDGFFDLIKRRFFTRSGAISFIAKLLGTSPTHDLEYLLNQIYWTDDQLEAVLDLLADKNLFRGYIDPIKQRIYNFKYIHLSYSSPNEGSIRYLTRFINASFQISSEVSLVNISRLTNLSNDDVLIILESIGKGLSYIQSKDNNYIYSTIDIVSQIIWDIYVYQEIPLDFWQARFDLAFDDLYNLLLLLNESFKGELSEKTFKGRTLIDWFKQGIDIEGLASKLHLNVLNLLKVIQIIADRLELRIIAGDSINPFLVKGIKDLEIFCQIDTSSYSNPSIYFECQNCRRVMCSNCRNIDSTHECPFCGNISAFIIDLPRNCPNCRLTYAYSYNLETTEECYFCEQGPLKSGWYSPGERTISLSSIESQLVDFIRNNHSTIFTLQQIIDFSNQSSDRVIAILEKLITHKIISGSINIRKMQLIIKRDFVSFECAVCNWVKTDQKKLICNSCKAEVCVNCYQGMESVGMIDCPECGSSLEYNE